MICEENGHGEDIPAQADGYHPEQTRRRQEYCSFGTCGLCFPEDVHIRQKGTEKDIASFPERIPAEVVCRRL